MTKPVIGGFAIIATFVATGMALAQDKFPFPPFRLEKIHEVSTDIDGVVERRMSTTLFERTPNGRVRKRSLALCSNLREIPPIFEQKFDGKQPEIGVGLTYDTTPQSGSFRCKRDSWFSQIEYRSSVTVDGDVYRFSAEITSSHAMSATKFRDMHREEAVIRFAEGSCTLVSYKHEQESWTSVVGMRKRVSTADANSLCRLVPERGVR